MHMNANVLAVYTLSHALCETTSREAFYAIEDELLALARAMGEDAYTAAVDAWTEDNLASSKPRRLIIWL